MLIGGIEEFFWVGFGESGPGVFRSFKDEEFFGLGEEFLILENAEFNDGIDLGPSGEELFSVGLIEGGELIGDFFGDMGGELPDSTVHLERAAGDVEGDVRAFESASEGDEEIGEEVFAVFRDENTVDVELDIGLVGVEPAVHPREEEDPFEVEGDVDVEVDPKDGVRVEGIEGMVEIEVVLLGAVGAVFKPEGLLFINSGAVESDGVGEESAVFLEDLLEVVLIEILL